MKSIIRHILFFCCLSLISTLPVEALPVADSTIVTQRSFDQDLIEEYKESGDYDYGLEPKKGSGLLEMLVFWLADFLQSIIYLGTDTQGGKFVIVLIIITVAIYVLLKILKIRANQLISNKEIGSLNGDAHEENIHELNLADLINKALKKNNYREAIRLTYLLALKSLSEKEIIHWMPGKTNSEYVNEIESKSLKTGFIDLNYYFVHTWYGNFEVDENHYSRVKSIYDNWKSGIDQ